MAFFSSAAALCVLGHRVTFVPPGHAGRMAMGGGIDMRCRRFIVGMGVLALALVTTAVPASAKQAAKQVPDPNGTRTHLISSGTNALLNPHTYAGGFSGWQ